MPATAVPWPLMSLPSVLPLVASPIIQLFWLSALGALFYGRWPSGRGPAWETGEATPWPAPQRRIPASRQLRNA